VTVFDEGLGRRIGCVSTSGGTREYALYGVRRSRRVYLPESYANLSASARLGLPNSGLAAIKSSHAVWDVSGGDSFSDIYGRHRFLAVALGKELALARDKPLILLPQTFGPFDSRRYRERARRIVSASTTAWARDATSLDYLKEILRVDFDPARHRLGVDMAFGLQVAEPSEEDASSLLDFLAQEDGPTVGINISGLLWGAVRGGGHYEVAVDYPRLMDGLCRELLRRGVRLVFVPHVLGYGPEGDEGPTRTLGEQLLRDYPGRLTVAPSTLGPGERKWLISRLDWFSGARMHATIAALSSGVPAAPLAYSRKFQGVFDSVGQGHQVVNGRIATTMTALEQLIASFDDRASGRIQLRSRVDGVLKRAAEQMDQIVASSLGRA
jgi:colanic acid/amylovoran biosynthesis protein